MPRPATAPGFHDRVSGLPESHLPTSLRNVQPEPEAAAEYKTPNTFRRSHTAGLAAFGLPEQGPPSWAGEIRLGLETARPTTRIRGCSCAPPPRREVWEILCFAPHRCNFTDSQLNTQSHWPRLLPSLCSDTGQRFVADQTQSLPATPASVHMWVTATWPLPTGGLWPV